MKSKNHNLKRKKVRRRERKDFKIYIFRVLKQVHPDLAISEKAMNVLNQMIVDLFTKFCEESAMILKIRKGKTLNCRDILYATRLLLTGQLQLHACSEAVKSYQNYKEYKFQFIGEKGNIIS